jgi:hypothetical protein
LLIWVGGEAENFFKQDWTGQIRLKCFNKFGFARKRGGPGFAAPQPGYAVYRRHCGERSDEAIQLSFRRAARWIASLRSQ